MGLGGIGDCLVELLLLSIDDAAGDVIIGVLRLEPDGLVQVGKGPVHPLAREKSESPMVVRRAVLWVEPDGFAQVLDGMVQLQLL